MEAERRETHNLKGYQVRRVEKQADEVKMEVVVRVGI